MAASYPKVLLAGLQASYDALETKDATKLYFCTDSGKLYKGDIDFSKYCEAVATRPNTPVVARLYVIAATGTAEFYDGTNWHVVSYQKVSSIDDSVAPASQSDATIPSTKAVAEYVAAIVGGSSDVVKSITAGTTDGHIVYTTADDQDHDVTLPGVFVTAAAGTTAGSVDFTDSDGDTLNVVVPDIVKGATAGTTAGSVVFTDTADQDSAVVVPGVVKGVVAATGANNAAKIVVSSTTAADETVTIPGVFVSVATGASDGQLVFTDSVGTTAGVTVPGVISDISWDGTARVITYTDTDGATGEINIGKDIFIDPTGNNRYENGNIYLYLNDGTQSTSATELVIPVTALVTDYFGDDTDSISVSIDNTTHKVTADAVLRQDVAGATGFTNALKLNSDTSAVGGVGLYVDLSDVEESIDALAEAITWGTF